MADRDDILLNSREVAFLLDLSPDKVNEFARRNILPAFKQGRQWRFQTRDHFSDASACTRNQRREGWIWSQLPTCTGRCLNSRPTAAPCCSYRAISTSCWRLQAGSL